MLVVAAVAAVAVAAGREEEDTEEECRPGLVVRLRWAEAWVAEPQHVPRLAPQAA